ncbi:hypothetical protein HZ994_12140 [Akkermansiaceae bacterium]|nr:hypothetical protein HZ994_12140 [Akkermansiaceae bacterium]
MKRNASRKALAASILLTGLAPSVLQGAVIYESFTFPDADTSLTGNPGGTGLSGNWTAGGGYTKNTGMTYGGLATAGDSSNAGSGWSKAEIGITASTAFSGLLVNGGDLWFSLILEVTSINNRTYMALTNNGIGPSNGALDAPGVGEDTTQGIGFALGSTELFHAALWEDNLAIGSNLNGTPANTVVGTQATQAAGTYFIVGHAQWGATALDNDTVTLYLPGTGLALGAVASTATGIVDQSKFDTLGIQNLTAGNRYDEIRVGATYADVTPVVPEPSAAVLGGLGALLLLRRRR